jgi:hypothetical protein
MPAHTMPGSPGSGHTMPAHTMPGSPGSGHTMVGG